MGPFLGGSGGARGVLEVMARRFWYEGLAFEKNWPKVGCEMKDLYRFEGVVVTCYGL